MTVRRRRRRSRLLLVFVAVLLLELALQVAAPVVQRLMARRSGFADPDAALTVLCIGDSHTYGLHLPDNQDYPSFVEATLAARYRRPITVENRGVPGQNTAQVLAGLVSDLDDVAPDLVLVLAGINDTWNRSGEDGGLSGLLSRLRLVRLGRVLAAGVTTARPFELRTDDAGEIVLDRGGGPRRVNANEGRTGGRTGDALREVVRRNLSRVVTACRDFGAVPVLMTYVESQPPFADVNRATRDLAAELSVLLVDHERAFAEHFLAHGYETLMFTDLHPNRAGYRLMAAGITAALEEAGLVPREELPERAVADVRPVPSLPRVVGRRPDAVLLEGPAGWSYQAIVSEAPAGPGDGFDQGAVRVPLRQGPLLAASLHEPAFSGRFEPGQTVVELPISRVMRDLAQGQLAVCVLLLRDLPRGSAVDAAPPVAAVAGPFLVDEE